MLTQALLARIALLAVLGMACGLSNAQAAQSPSRGRLLYELHCVACHDSKMHWREASQAKDWASLNEQVRRWQSAAGLQWSEDDIADVAAHLNDTIYHHPPLTQHVRFIAPTR